MKRQTIPKLIVLFSICFLTAVSVHSEHLPIKIYTSADGGETWTNKGAFATSLASSADGNHLAGASYGQIVISTNAGETWVSANVPFKDYWGIASSWDGSRLIAVA